MDRLRDVIFDTPMADTHDHQVREDVWLAEPADILTDLFRNYICDDLQSAGATPEQTARLLDPNSGSITERFQAIAPAWELCRHTGYGEALRLTAARVFGLHELHAEALEEAQERYAAMRHPGRRLQTLRDVAMLDHVHNNLTGWDCSPDGESPQFFFYDLSVAEFVTPWLQLPDIQRATGVYIDSLSTLRQALEALFERQGPQAVGVKTQHAYHRTLAWQPRTDAEAESALARVLAGADNEADRLTVGDWCMERSCELAQAYRLPIKIHTGHYAGVGRMTLDWVHPAHLCTLATRFPQVRFVLFHAGYPFGPELIAMAKHYPNVYADMCWAWAIDPYRSIDFLRSMLHAAPVNKLLVFGGDSWSPNAVVGYAIQARTGIWRALDAETRERGLSVSDAVEIAQRLLRGNARALFEIDRRQAAVC